MKQCANISAPEIYWSMGSFEAPFIRKEGKPEKPDRPDAGKMIHQLIR
jgi:hypothetical protein